jgi:hypothetical protein
MTTATRIWLSVALFGVTLTVQGGLLAHMALGPSNVYPAMHKTFADLPTTLAVEAPGLPAILWSFVPHPAEKSIRKSLPFDPVDLIYRHCRAPEQNIDAVCYLVHSADGEDRKHHPDICIRDVQGVPEIEKHGALVDLGDPKLNRKVLRKCFASGQTHTMTVYYWHYTFAPEAQRHQTWLQMLHQTFSRFPPSVTVQITTTASPEQWPMIEKALLAPLDDHLRLHYLPDGAVMGCDRLPIAIAPK